MLVLLNFSDEDSNIELNEAALIEEVLINNFETVEIKENKIFLKPYKAFIFSLNSTKEN